MNRKTRTVDSTITLSLPNHKGNQRNSEGSFLALNDERIMFAWSRYHGGSWAARRWSRR